MKKILFFMMLVVSIASCRKDPFPDLDGKYLVYTEASENVDFTKYSSFYVVDSVRVSEYNRLPYYSKSEGAKKLIEQVQTNMKNMGYTLGNSTDADVMISLDYVFKMATTLDIKMTLPKTEQEKEVLLWSAHISGYHSYDQKYNMDRLTEGIDQAFEQSQYIKRK